MKTAELRRLVERVSALEPMTADRDRLREAAGEVGRLQSFLEGRAVAIARRLADLSPSPERDLAGAARTSAREAERLLDRAKVTVVAPALGDALDAGAIGAEHVDVFGRGLRSLEQDLQPQLVAAAPDLVAVAERSTPEDFDRAVRAEVRRLRRDDGQARLEQQRRATRLRTWVDREGMWCLSGRFDPETGVRLHRRLLDAVGARFADTVPEFAPDDPGQRADFLRAHALAALLDSGTAGAAGGAADGASGRGVRRAGAPEIIVVVDATGPDASGMPSIDWGLPVELPAAVLHELWPQAVIHPVVVAGGIVVHAPGELNLGRTTRLANRAQRRALRALYPTCAIPTCHVGFDHCDVHHVIWWEAPHYGRTDVNNLLPLCCRHHHAVHDRGWQLHLAADRTLTIRYPDGRRETTGPPRRNPSPTSTPRVPMRT
jgi:hypothetical protein